jgi:uncharacterized protein (DUF1778 family)
LIIKPLAEEAFSFGVIFRRLKMDRKEVAIELIKIAKSFVAKRENYSIDNLDERAGEKEGAARDLYYAVEDLVEYVENEIKGDEAAKRNHKKVLDAVKSAMKNLKKVIIAKSLVAMKIKPEDYKKLKDALDETIRKIGKDKLMKHKESLKDDSRVKDLEKRFRWDLLYASKIKIGDGKGAPGDIDLYAYMNDDQIDTALKKYVKEAGLEG